MASHTEATGTAPMRLTRDLRAAETDLQKLRSRIRTVAEFIHDPAFDLDARRALAQRLDLPAPSPAPAASNNGGGSAPWRRLRLRAASDGRMPDHHPDPAGRPHRLRATVEGDQSVSQPSTTAEPTAQASFVDQNLKDSLASVHAEIGRSDTKAGLLLAFNGAVFAGLAGSADRQLPPLCLVVGGLAVLALAASTVLLLLVVLPRLRGTDRASFPYWAKCDTQQIIAEMSIDRRADRLRVLSEIALPKFEGLGRAIRLSLAAVGLMVIGVVALIGPSLAGR